MATASEDQRVTRGAPLYELDKPTVDLLQESAPLMQAWSETSCVVKASGGMEEWAKSQQGGSADRVPTCDWYHGTWQLLRLLNMVAVPPWYPFYSEALGTVLQERPDADVLISAAADYGMLCTLHEAIVATESSPHVVICDICETPLLASQWYAERNHFQLECICDDLLTTDSLRNESFDLIVTDELLTVLKAASKPTIVDRWKKLLKAGGTVVTTAMIGDPTTPELRDSYARRARDLLDAHFDRFSSLSLDRHELIERFDRFAEVHTRHMVTGTQEVEALFSEFDLEFSLVDTPGECVNPTTAFQITARKRSS